MSDDAKKTILARRARFIAAAMAGLAVPGCTKAVPATDAGPVAEVAEAALSAAAAAEPVEAAAPARPAEPADAGAAAVDTSPDASTLAVQPRTARPHPSVGPRVVAPPPPPPAPPQVCLSPPPPPERLLKDGGVRPKISTDDPWSN